MGRRGAARGRTQPPKRRGFAGSIPQVGLALGLALGTGVFALLQTVMPTEAFLSYGWRIAFLFSIVLVIFGVVVRLKAAETPAFEKVRERRRPCRRCRCGKCSAARRCARRCWACCRRWGEGAAFNTWGVFAIAYATRRPEPCTSKRSRADRGDRGRLVDGGAAAGFGSAADRSAPSASTPSVSRPTASRCSRCSRCSTPAVSTRIAIACLVFGIIHAWFYGAQGTLYASLFPARIRYTGLSTVYQLSGVYSSGLTPLILTALIAVGGNSPWLACGYLVTTAVISVVATLLLRPRSQHDI